MCGMMASSSTIPGSAPAVHLKTIIYKETHSPRHHVVA